MESPTSSRRAARQASIPSETGRSERGSTSAEPIVQASSGPAGASSSAGARASGSSASNPLARYRGKGARAMAAAQDAAAHEEPQDEPEASSRQTSVARSLGNGTSRRKDRKRRRRGQASAEPSGSAADAGNEDMPPIVEVLQEPVDTTHARLGSTSTSRASGSELAGKASSVERGKRRRSAEESSGSAMSEEDGTPPYISAESSLSTRNHSGPSSRLSPVTSVDSRSKGKGSRSREGKAITSGSKRTQRSVSAASSRGGGQPQDSELSREVERLRKELVSKDMVIAAQRSTLSHVSNACSCTICLEIAWRPHILVPCGHIFCARCLISWFKKPLPEEGALPDYLVGEARVAEEQRRTKRRKKMCPHCRADVTSVPVEVWLVKGLLDRIEASVLAGHTEEDGEELQRQKDSITLAEGLELRGENLEQGPKMWENIFDDRPKQTFIYDEADGVYRCGACHSEIWDQVCTNPSCGLSYSDMSDFADEHDWADHAAWDERDADFDSELITLAGNGGITFDGGPTRRGGMASVLDAAFPAHRNANARGGRRYALDVDGSGLDSDSRTSDEYGSGETDEDSEGNLPGFIVGSEDEEGSTEGGESGSVGSANDSDSLPPQHRATRRRLAAMSRRSDRRPIVIGDSSDGEGGTDDDGLGTERPEDWEDQADDFIEADDGLGGADGLGGDGAEEDEDDHADEIDLDIRTARQSLDDEEDEDEGADEDEDEEPETDYDDVVGGEAASDDVGLGPVTSVVSDDDGGTEGELRITSRFRWDRDAFEDLDEDEDAYEDDEAVLHSEDEEAASCASEGDHSGQDDYVW